MLDKVIDSINEIQNGDTLKISVPMGDSTLVIDGTASVSSDGTVTITSSGDCKIDNWSLSNAKLVINRGKKLSKNDPINASISGQLFGADVSADLSIKDNKLTVSNAPIKGLNKTYDIPENAEFSISNPQADTRRKKPSASIAQEASANGDNKDKSYSSKSEGYQENHAGLTNRANEFGATDDPSNHDENMWHTHSTRQTGSYGQGENINLANNPQLDNIITSNKNSGKQLFSDKSKDQFSKFDFVATYAATGQYSVEDLFRSADALASEGLITFSATSHADYWPDEFQKILDNTSDINYDTVATQLQEDVEYLTEEFAKVHDQMTEWSGAASGAAKDAIECILGKFECTMANITGVVGPACKMVEDFKEKLETLKAGKEELTGADGNGGLDKELEDLTKDYEEKKAKLDQLKANEPSKTKTETGANGSTRTVSNPEYSTWQSQVATATDELNTAEQKMNEKDEEIKAKEAELDELLEEVLKAYFLIKNLVQTVSSFKEYFGNGSKAYMISSADAVVKYHDQIVDDFESFESMPTITSILGYYDEEGNFVDYQIGDLVLLDDAHGYVYKITALDPKTLTMTIVAVDKEGKEIGSPIIITDSREIAEVQHYVKKLAEKVPSIQEEYKDYFKEKDPEPILTGTETEKPPTGQTQPTQPKQPTQTQPTQPKQPTQTQPTQPKQPTQTQPTQPKQPTQTQPTQPKQPTQPTQPQQPTPAAPTQPVAPTSPQPTPGTIAGPGTFGPYGGEVYGSSPVSRGGEVAPHTGLDSISGANSEDTLESAAGLGAIAALAAGAAGLGLTEFFDRKKKKEEEEEENKKEETE